MRWTKLATKTPSWSSASPFGYVIVEEKSRKARGRPFDVVYDDPRPQAKPVLVGSFVSLMNAKRAAERHAQLKSYADID